MNEADIYRKFVLPKLQAAGWKNDPHSIAEQRFFTEGRIIGHGTRVRGDYGKTTDIEVLTTEENEDNEGRLGETTLFPRPSDGRGIEGEGSRKPQQVVLRAGKQNANPFDLLCHLAFNAPVLTRRQRADRMKKQELAFFNFFTPEAREILNDLLEKYAADGELQFTLPDVLKVRPISDHGNVNEIIGKFGGAEQLRNAVKQLQTLLYAA